MSEVISTLLFVGSVLLFAQLSPGPDFIYVFRTSLAMGWRAGALLGLGISIGFTVQLSIVCAVGSRLLEQSWSHYLLFLAAAYLLYLAWKIFPKKFSQDRPDLDLADLGAEDKKISSRRLILSGFLCNIVNLKCMLFIVGVCIGGLQAYESISWYIPVLMIWLFLIGAGGWALWAGLLQWGPLRRYYKRHIYWVDMAFSLLLVAAAVYLFNS